EELSRAVIPMHKIGDDQRQNLRCLLFDGHNPASRNMSVSSLQPSAVKQRGQPSSLSLCHHHLRPAQHKLRLLAGVAVLYLLGDAQRVHAVHTTTADALVKSG